jgi:hypothetical protein
VRDTGPKRLKVINLFGSAGVGKSALRAGLFSLLKAYDFRVEEVTEYAKYLVMTGQLRLLKEQQMQVFAEQHHRQLVVQSAGYDYAITDSPLPLSAFYAPAGYLPTMWPVIQQAFDGFDNLNVFVTRDRAGSDTPFEELGRAHDRAASVESEPKLRRFLSEKGINCTNFEIAAERDLLAPFRLMNHLFPASTPIPAFS